MTTTNFLRAGVRLPLELPVEVRWKGRRGEKQHAQGKTVTISGNGFYVVLPKRLDPQTPIDFTVDLPMELTRVPMKLRGRGRVVRANPSNAEAGVGATIDDYQFQLTAPEV
jgi:PilZ domain-containing protein